MTATKTDIATFCAALEAAITEFGRALIGERERDTVGKGEVVDETREQSTEVGGGKREP
jgi:hypothetical protein